MFLNLLNGNREALALLDWFQIVDNISSLSHFELTKNKLSAPPPYRSLLIIQKDLDRLDLFLKNYDDYSLLFSSKLRTLPEDAPSFSLIYDLHKSRFFNTSELNFFALLIEAYYQNYSSFKEIKFEEDFHLLPEILQKIKRNYIVPLREFIDFSGNASYERHPVLKKLYADVLALESDLRQTIQKISKTDQYSSKLQMDNYDIINDRYVLAIKADSYNFELGPIISRSQSGMTLFIEPLEVREKSNRRIYLLAEIEAIILRLTIELSKTIHQFSNEMELISKWILELDWLNTKATYSLKFGLSKPTLTDSFHFELEGLFHPLLKNPVGNNLLLDQKHKGLIISGPNTGGKTVVLKSLCLSILFLHLGLYVPARFAELNPVQNLFYFSHDHQNLSAGLSSFASEAKYYLELLQTLGEHNLIVIDEIFNSTSSEEASVLAISFLEEVHLRSFSKIILSTHHQILKTFMHSRADYVSAHVGFDFESNLPTYKLILGEPGSSLAFKIFDNLSQQFGLVTDISSKAKTMLDQKQVTYESLLQELSFKKIELDKLLTNNRNLQNELKNQKASMEGVLFLEKEKILNDYSKKMRSHFELAENLLEETKKGEVENRRQLNKSINTIQSNFNKENNQPPTVDLSLDKYSHLAPLSFSEIELDMTVFSLKVKKNVKVVQINPRKNEVQIKHGALSLWENVSQLRRAQGSKPKTPSVSINIQRSVKGEIEIDCRGMRLVDFQKTCEQAIDEVSSGEIPFVTIIHGHGDGILKNWLRSYLKKEHKDLHFENIDGNDGCTKISLG